MFEAEQYINIIHARRIEYDLEMKLKSYGKIFIEFTLNDIIIIIEDLSRDNCQWTSIEKICEISKEVIDLIFEENSENELENRKFLLMFLGVPTFPISMNEGSILISCKKGDTISRIDRIIGDCDCIEFERTDDIVGGVLSLLKLKQRKIQLDYPLNSPSWQEIVIHYLNGDRDILDCQEELISAGYKEYARL
jgi:hypothetical protein